jgi:hypothetical protein
MKRKNPLVLFNASVVLAGINSPKGGSAELLVLVKNKKINGAISEIIYHEVIKNASKINLERSILEKKVDVLFPYLLKAPLAKIVSKFFSKTTDPGDAHVLASALEIKADFLVSLDKKHILVLKNKVREFKIVTPGELVADFLNQSSLPNN